MSLKGKAAIVTGSTSGIGQAIAEALAAQGCNIMLNGFGDASVIEKQRLGIEQDKFASSTGTMRGLEYPHKLEIAVDGARVHTFKMGGEADFKANLVNMTKAGDVIESHLTGLSRIVNRCV